MPSACLVVENKATYWPMYNVDEWALRLSYLCAEKWRVFNHGTGRLRFMKQLKLKKCKTQITFRRPLNIAQVCRWYTPYIFQWNIPFIYRLRLTYNIAKPYANESVKQYREIRCSLYSQGICVNQFVLWLKCKSMSRAINSNDWTFHSGFLQLYSHIPSCTRPA